jgi:L-malate glycosyltransferase
MVKEKSPKMAFLANSLNPGGAEKLIVEMAIALSSDYGTEVICLDEPGLWASDLRQHKVPVYCLYRQPGFDLDLVLRLARHLRKHEIEIIHAHQCTPWFYGALSRLIFAKPRLLLEEHGRFHPEVKKRKRILFNWAILRGLTHRFVAVSEDIRKRLAAYEGLDYRRIEVIYNGVAAGPRGENGVRRKMRAELGLGEEDFVVGTVGRFDTIKNLPLFMNSLSEVRREKLLRGVCIGDGPEFNRVRDLRDRLGLGNCVVMTGYRSDAGELIQSMDVFVLSSFSEGTSVALLEAMASGVPAIVTDVGGNPEIVVNGETGWVVESDSMGAMVGAIQEAYRQRGLLQSYGRAARERFEERFTFKKMIKSYQTIYSEMIRNALP